MFNDVLVHSGPKVSEPDGFQHSVGPHNLLEIIQEIGNKGGGPIKKDHNKYALRATVEGNDQLLVRMVTDTRKGPLEQAMVPQQLVKSTLQMHHEGYGHMGTNS